MIQYNVPTIYTHLAIAKRYMERNAVQNAGDVYDGSVMPDIEKDKEKSHYGGSRTESGDIVQRNAEKIGLKKFLEQNSDDNDLNNGMFLHLYADWVYYNEMLPKEKIRKMTWQEYTRDLVFTFGFYDKVVATRYDLNFECTKFAFNLKERYDFFAKIDKEAEQWNLTPIYSYRELEDFIESVAKVNLADVKARVLRGEYDC
jgi:hypothetical protein